MHSTQRRKGSAAQRTQSYLRVFLANYLQILNCTLLTLREIPLRETAFELTARDRHHIKSRLTFTCFHYPLRLCVAFTLRPLREMHLN
jgi:hypothetical protein